MGGITSTMALMAGRAVRSPPCNSARPFAAWGRDRPGRDGEPVTRFGVQGETTGGAGLAVQGEVDVELQRLPAKRAYGEGANDGFLGGIEPARPLSVGVGNTISR
jgi:hypothetical protein